MDRLSTLLSQFGMHATTLFAGTLECERTYSSSERSGKLHLISTDKTYLFISKQKLLICEPSLLFVPRPLKHQLIAANKNTQLASASVSFDGGLDNPLTTALPEYMLFPINEITTLGDSVIWLFNEITEQNCGRNAVINRLCELVMIQVLRHIMSNNSISTGMMAGLADLRLAHAVTLMHNHPAKNWTVAELANAANMSRASFAAQFNKVIGRTPADYLLTWRVSLTQKRLREGRPISIIADEVGYDSPSALARAFRRKTGVSPREWLKK